MEDVEEPAPSPDESTPVVEASSAAPSVTTPAAKAELLEDVEIQHAERTKSAKARRSTRNKKTVKHTLSLSNCFLPPVRTLLSSSVRVWSSA
ncbi:hypothetical protein RSAG8_11150, partial [Rhizoctonia solani AG-8 WAC10335]